MIAPNVIIIWSGTHAGIPSGFSRETSLDDKYPKGWGIENVNTTGGSNTHSHTSPAHAHTMISHSHSGTTGQPSNSRVGSDAGGPPCSTDTHTHAYNISGVTGGTLSDAVSYASINGEPPYHEVIFIKATGFRSVPDDGIILSSNATIPSGFVLCNGETTTPDLTDKYLKGASTGEDAGDVAGSLNHEHSINHTHTGVTHTHVGTSASNNNAYDSENGGSTQSTTNHTHTVTLSAAGSETGSAYTDNAGIADDVEPVYKKLIALQNISGVNKVPKSGMVGMWLGDIDEIPTGWFLCDGTEGTPDMQDNFLKIAVDETEIEDIGGSNTHTHTSSNSHTHTASGSHTHTGSTDTFNPSLTSDGSGGGATVSSHSHSISSASSSTTSSWNDATVEANSSSNQPAYRTVAYIMFKFGITGGGIPMSML